MKQKQLPKWEQGRRQRKKYQTFLIDVLYKNAIISTIYYLKNKYKSFVFININQ